MAKVQAVESNVHYFAKFEAYVGIELDEIDDRNDE